MYTEDDLYADSQREIAREKLKKMIQERSTNSEVLEGLADYVDGGWQMLADAGYVPSKINRWITEIL